MFCVAMQGADPAALQAGLNWACGQGHADCTAIQPGGPCYKQNNLQALASYAYNDYYQRSAKTSTACDFNGTATTTPTDPSKQPCSNFRRSLLLPCNPFCIRIQSAGIAKIQFHEAWKHQ
jgi:hypothetical protein